MDTLNREQLGVLARQNGVGLVAMFGSASRGASHPADIDLALLPSESRGAACSSDGLPLARCLARELRRGDLDVVWLPVASSVLWQEVARDGVSCYEERPGLFHEFQLEALRRLWDEALWHRRNQRFIQRVVEGDVELNRVLVTQELAAVAEYLEKLEQVMQVDLERFVSDFTQHHLAERLLELLVEAATTINTEVGQSVARVAGSDYYSSFFVIAQAGWISSDLARALGDLVLVRNRLVHRYHQVQLDELYVALKGSLPQWRDYLSGVAAKLTSG